MQARQMEITFDAAGTFYTEPFLAFSDQDSIRLQAQARNTDEAPTVVVTLQGSWSLDETEDEGWLDTTIVGEISGSSLSFVGPSDIDLVDYPYMGNAFTAYRFKCVSTGSGTTALRFVQI